MESLTKITNTPLNEVIESFNEIPFGNSDFQIENFIINAGLTPERAFRSICLTMRAKITALRDAFYGKQRLEVDLDELREKINDPNINKFEKRRCEISINEKLDQQKDTEKLIMDAKRELETLYKYWKMLPHPTREEFEGAEFDYYKESLYRQTLGIQGAVDSLTHMGLRLNENKELIQAPTLLGEIKELIALNAAKNNLELPSDTENKE